MLLTSFVEPALSDYINFIHSEKSVSERVRNRRLGRGTVDFSLGPFQSQLQLAVFEQPLLNEKKKKNSAKEIGTSSITLHSLKEQ